MDFHGRPYRGRGLRHGRCGASRPNPVIDLDHWARSGEAGTEAGKNDAAAIADPGAAPVDDAGADRRPEGGRPTPEVDAATADLIRRLLRTIDDEARPRVGVPPSSSRLRLPR
ncbi:MAG: hypothetical protein AAGA59_00630 [Actinomycetota bacterium]